MWKQIFILLFFVGVFSIAAAPGASTSSPDNALAPIGETQTIAAHSAQWYKFDVGGGKNAVTATVDADASDGLRLAIYTPEQIANWQNGDALTAIGMGSAHAEHALAWFGEFNQAGTYYAVVYNDSDAPLEVNVRVEGDAVTTQKTETQVTAPNDPLLPQVPVGDGVSGRIAFVDSSGGNVYTVNGDGTNLQRVSFGMDPQWSNDGTQIALARQGPVAGIFTINADGSNEELIYATNEPRSPDWSPDDSEIVFSYQGATKGGETRCFRGRCMETPSTTEWKLGAVALSDNSYHDVRSSEIAFTPTWNVDGTIAYNDTSIGLMTTLSTGEPSANPFIGDLRVTSDSYNPLRIMSPQYSPDGAKIVYMVQQSPTWQIAVANADGSDAHLLTSDVALALTHPSNVAPVWSPDSSQIMFLSNRNGKWEIFVMNADGSNVQQVLKNVTDTIDIQYDFQAGRMLSWTDAVASQPE
ncbi:MAG: hypothetical protein DCC52_08935 [Chloroflexi bacterium]|nr:MAG: hypothetical protein DCC52_08935 [Chloroflexota bacterium]